MQIVDCEIQSGGESLFGERRYKMPQPRRSMGSQQIWAPTKKVTQFGNRTSFSEGVSILTKKKFFNSLIFLKEQLFINI